MSKIDLALKIGIPTGQDRSGNWQFKYLPREIEGFPVEYITSKGGVKRGFRDEQSINNEMEIGDELRQTIYQGNLMIGRVSDGNSLDFYEISKSGKRILVGLKVDIYTRDNIRKRLLLLIHYASITWFNRSTLNGSNFEQIKFSFDSRHARIDYATRDFNGAIKEAEKLMADAASSVVGSIKAIRF